MSRIDISQFVSMLLTVISSVEAITLPKNVGTIIFKTTLSACVDDETIKNRPSRNILHLK